MPEKGDVMRERPVGRLITDIADFSGEGIDLAPARNQPYDLKKDFAPIGTVVHLRLLEEPVTVDAALTVHDGRIFDHSGSFREGAHCRRVYFNVEDIVLRAGER